MSRKNGAASADDAASAARQRFAARLGLPRDEQRGAEVSDDGRDGAWPEGVRPGGAHRGHDDNEEPLLPLWMSHESGSGTSKTAGVSTEPGISGESDLSRDARGPSLLRWRTPWRVAVVLAIPCLLLLLWFVWQARTGQATVEPLVRSSFARGTAGVGPANGPESTENASPDSHGSRDAQSGQLTVHVAGAVKNPGIVRLSAGARVFDAIAAAGGTEPAAELNSLNLAALVQDAAKIHVPRLGEAVPEPAPGTGVSGGASADANVGAGNAGTGNAVGGKLNLNTATAEELDTLPKVGPVLAKRIVEWRHQHGPFVAVEDLDAVDGVGPKMMETLLPLVTV